MSPEQRRLFDAFVEEWQAFGRSPELDGVAGIGTRTLRRYVKEMEVPSKLEPASEVAMARFLTGRGKKGFEAFLRQEGRAGASSSLSETAAACVRAMEKFADAAVHASRAAEYANQAALLELQKAPEGRTSTMTDVIDVDPPATKRKRGRG